MKPNLLIKLFIKDYQNHQSPAIRNKYAFLGSTVGIICNLLLFLAKLLIGLISGSIAIIADSLNNLSDSGASLVALLGFKMASRPPDKEHPFGHGRYEHLSSLAICALILLMGFQLILSSAPKLFSSVPVVVDITLVVILSLSILLKLWMCFFYRSIGKTIESTAILAASEDARNDVLVTSSVLVSLIISRFIGFSLDGWMGLALAVFILISGASLFKKSINPILGEAPSKELVKQLNDMVCSYEGILGTHDMIFHNYGANRWLATIHAEVPAEQDILFSHEVIDTVERDVLEKLGIHLVIHMDPIVTHDARVTELKHKTVAAIKEIDSVLELHDFRMVEGKSRSNLIFDVLVPYEYKIDDEKLLKLINAKVKLIDPSFFAVVTIDRSYV
ncbi:MAG: cation diffusion facilitator family transporter [Oscillospiraceae bacterium]|jgi:cation diffusion facilitator family transporter|nr:cation diffusion facilitator family transporter [Oscillospiraceae bacterium]